MSKVQGVTKPALHKIEGALRKLASRHRLRIVLLTLQLALQLCPSLSSLTPPSGSYSELSSTHAESLAHSGRVQFSKHIEPAVDPINMEGQQHPDETREVGQNAGASIRPDPNAARNTYRHILPQHVGSVYPRGIPASGM